MEWNVLYDQSNPPALADVEEYVGSELWKNLNSLLQETYRIQPRLSYSQCSMKPGWNVKYRKAGKSLCTLYPMDGFFIALIVIAKKEIQETELLMPLFTGYIRELYQNAASSAQGRWLMINVTEPEIAEDVFGLIQIRASLK